MSHGTYICTIHSDSNQAVQKVVDRLNASGLRVIRSFDLQSARATHADCTCPHHGNEKCDCQLVVLLVYDDPGSMLTIVVHGRDKKTDLTLADYPRNLKEFELKGKIFVALALEGTSISKRKIESI